MEKGNCILTCVSNYDAGSGSVNRFIGYSQVVTTINYYTIAGLCNLESLHTNILSLISSSLDYPFPDNGFITQELWKSH
jgi:hypothetical protein